MKRPDYHMYQMNLNPSSFMTLHVLSPCALPFCQQDAVSCVEGGHNVEHWQKSFLLHFCCCGTDLFK